MDQPTPAPAKKSKFKLSITTIVMAIALLLAIGAAVYFWNDAQTARDNPEEQLAAQNQAESASVLENLNRVLLTESETEPTVARVEDPTVLIDANPDFYKNVQTGDYLILYPQRAILFRNTESRVINVAPIINAGDLQQGTDEATSEVDIEQ